MKIELDATESKIFNILREASKEMPGRPVVRVAGGWIRDKLLGRSSKDIDVTVSNMTGEQFGDHLAAFDKRRGLGAVSAISNRSADQTANIAVGFLKIYGQEVEILNLRGKEEYREGDRNPISTGIGTPEQDAYRRDLTINSLFYNINTGQVEDFTGKGYEDLATMTLRTPLEPVQTFTDDPLRLLRVLRFNSRYPNAKIDIETLEAMKDPTVQFQIVRKLINPDDPQGIVPERTADEFRKIMQGEQPEAAIRTMFQTGLLQKILGLPAEFYQLDMDQRNPHHQLTVIEHTLEVIKNTNKLSKEFELDDEQRMMMNMTALFHDLGKLDPRSHKEKPDGTRGYMGNPVDPDSLTHQHSSADQWKRLAKALKLSENETQTIHALVEGHMNPHAHIEGSENQASDKQLRKYIRNNPLWVFQYIHAMADAASKSEVSDAESATPYRENLTRLRELAPTADAFGNTPPSQDILDGRVIMDMASQYVGQPVSPKPPPGEKSYIEVIKELIREEQDSNPNLSMEEATSIAQNWIVTNFAHLLRTV